MRRVVPRIALIALVKSGSPVLQRAWLRPSLTTGALFGVGRSRQTAGWRYASSCGEQGLSPTGRAGPGRRCRSGADQAQAIRDRSGRSVPILDRGSGSRFRLGGFHRKGRFPHRARPGHRPRVRGQHLLLCGDGQARLPGWSGRASRPLRTAGSGNAGQARRTDLAISAGSSRRACGADLANSAGSASRAGLARRAGFTRRTRRAARSWRTHGALLALEAGFSTLAPFPSRTRRTSRTDKAGRLRTHLATGGDHDPAGLLRGPQRRDAAGRMIDHAKLKVAAAVGSLRELVVQGDLSIRIVGVADDPKIAAGDLRRLNAHVGQGGCRTGYQQVET